MKKILEIAEEKGFKLTHQYHYYYLELCLIQKWLIEEHGVIVCVIFNGENYDVEITGGAYIDIEGLETYQQALQKGLEEGLKLI